MSKRKANIVEDPTEVLTRMQDAGISAPEVFSHWEPEEVAIYFAHVANLTGVKDRAFKKARITLPSSSAASWTNMAFEWGFPFHVESLELDPFIVPECFLPPSFHKRTYEAAWAALDVYREPEEQATEASRLKSLEPVSTMYYPEASLPNTPFLKYILNILALFRGRMYDLPEKSLPASKWSSGGEVAHEVSRPCLKSMIRV